MATRRTHRRKSKYGVITTVSKHHMRTKKKKRVGKEKILYHRTYPDGAKVHLVQRDGFRFLRAGKGADFSHLYKARQEWADASMGKK